MTTTDYMIIMVPGFLACVGVAWIAGMAHAEARKAREVGEAILARLDRASADRYARQSAELARLRDLHAPPVDPNGNARPPAAPADAAPAGNPRPG